jgi:hypothetical protein
MQRERRDWAIRVDKTVRDTIEQLALVEDRTPAALVRVLVREALRARGLLPPPMPMPNGTVADHRTETAA